MFRVIRGKYAKIVFETHAVFVYCVNARRAACGKGRGRGCVLFAFASAAPDPFLVEPQLLPVSTAPAQGLNIEEGGEWLEHLPEFKAWLASLSTKTLYRHLLESLNFANGDDGLVEELTPSQLDLAVAATDDTGFDAHLAEALGEEEMSDHCSSSSEEDENNEAVS